MDVTIIPTIAESWRVPTEAIQEAVDEAISQLPPVNDATLTIKQNGITKGTFTANDADDTTVELENTTYEDFTGTDGTSTGTAGLVPAPTAQDADKFLKSDGTWSTGGGGTVILYDETGQNTDGAMTQKATTDALGGKQDTLTAGANINIDADNEISATDTTYTAGTGLSLSGTEFLADTTVLATQTDLSNGLATKQNTLTAGSNIQINNDTISATDTTYSDFTGTDGTAVGTAGLVPAPATTDAGKYLKADGTWDEVSGGIPTNATFWGASYDSVNNKVSGNLIMPSGLSGIRGLWAYDASNAPKIGFDAQDRPKIDYYGELLFTVPSSANENTLFEFSGTTTGQRIKLKGGTDSQTLRISGVTDPTAAQDAATKNYVDTHGAVAFPTSIFNEIVGA